MKTAISIPDQEFEAAEKLAIRLGMSRSELYRKAITEFVTKYSDEHVTAKLNEIYGPKGGTEAIDTELLCLQDKSIPHEKW